MNKDWERNVVVYSWDLSLFYFHFAFRNQKSPAIELKKEIMSVTPGLNTNFIFAILAKKSLVSKVTAETGKHLLYSVLKWQILILH